MSSQTDGIKKENSHLGLKESVKVVASVSFMVFKIYPTGVIMQVISSTISATLPLMTAFFAGLTTTSLAEAYSGDETAGSRAILYIIITVALGLSVSVWGNIEQYVKQKMNHQVEIKLNDQMYNHFLNLDFWRYDDANTADVYEKAQRFTQFMPFIFSSLASILSAIITVILAVNALFFINWVLGLFVILSFIPSIIIEYKIATFNNNHWKKNIKNRRAKYMIEDLFTHPGAMGEIRAYGLIKHLLGLRKKHESIEQQGAIEYRKKFLLQQTISQILQASVELAGLIWVAIQIIQRAQPIGQFIFIQQLLSATMSSVRSAIISITSISQDLTNMMEYNQFINIPIRKEGNIKLVSDIEEVSLKNVYFKYPGSKKYTLKDISMDIKAGERIAIVGENGAGKTTLLKLLIGLYYPSKGSIKIDGRDLSTLNLELYHKNIGILQQDFVKYSFLSAKENVTVGDTSVKENPARLKKALEEAEAYDFVHNLPHGQDSYVDKWMGDLDEGGVELSGGQWQRLALARNFYRNSPIVILDEPTSAIDALAESSIFKKLFNNKNQTVIMISHRYTTIKHADIIYMMKDGEIVERGTAKELIALGKNGEFYKMFEAQI